MTDHVITSGFIRIANAFKGFAGLLLHPAMAMVAANRPRHIPKRTKAEPQGGKHAQHAQVRGRIVGLAGDSRRR
jgi:hypothetical protein